MTHIIAKSNPGRNLTFFVYIVVTLDYLSIIANAKNLQLLARKKSTNFKLPGFLENNGIPLRVSAHENPKKFHSQQYTLA